MNASRSTPSTTPNERSSRRLLAMWMALSITLVAGRAAIATASPGWHPSPPARGPHVVVWVSRTGVVRPKTELAAAKPPSIKPARGQRDHTGQRNGGNGNARDAHGPAAPDPVVVERSGSDHHVLPKLQDHAIAVAPALDGPASARSSALSVTRITRHAAHAALFHDAHAPPQHA